MRCCFHGCKRCSASDAQRERGGVCAKTVCRRVIVEGVFERGGRGASPGRVGERRSPFRLRRRPSTRAGCRWKKCVEVKTGEGQRQRRRNGHVRHARSVQGRECTPSPSNLASLAPPLHAGRHLHGGREDCDGTRLLTQPHQQQQQHMRASNAHHKAHKS